MTPLTDEQVQFTVHRVAQWLKTKYEFERTCEGTPRVDSNLEADALHSALLQRLLNGDEVLPHAEYLDRRG